MNHQSLVHEAFAMKYIKPGLYKHFKGNNYLIISTVVHTENEAPLVLYTAESNKENKLWTRPLELFFSEIETSDGLKTRFSFLRNLNENEKRLIKRRLFT